MHVHPSPMYHAPVCRWTTQGNFVKDVPTKLYFDPHSYSPRSIVHEVSHYIAKWSGDDKLFKDEVAIDTIARSGDRCRFYRA